MTLTSLPTSRGGRTARTLASPPGMVLEAGRFFGGDKVHRGMGTQVVKAAGSVS